MGLGAWACCWAVWIRVLFRLCELEQVLWLFLVKSQGANDELLFTGTAMVIRGAG